MTSKSIEDSHAAELRKLILEAGLECTRVLPDVANISFEYVEEEEVFEEVVPEVQPVIEEEERSVTEEEPHEEKPAVFPTPSLRRVLSTSFRAALQDNTIHVLPETFKTKIDPEAIPHIITTPKKIYIETLAAIVGCTEYTRSLAEYWFLDTLANLLRRAQADNLDKPTQVLLILWFCEWMKEMQHFDAASRQRMMTRFQDNMLNAATFIGDTSRIPTPSEVNVYYKAQDERTEVESKASTRTSNIKMNVSFIATEYECSLLDLSKILHYIFDLFSTDYQYNLIRSVFTFPPDYIHVDYPYQIQTPKRMYQVQKPKAQKHSKKEKSSPPPKLGSNNFDKVLSDYEALMELKTQEQKELDEQEERDREDWNVQNSILPLYMAVTEALYDQYWPHPPPVPEEELESKKLKKGKKKGK